MLNIYRRQDTYFVAFHEFVKSIMLLQCARKEKVNVAPFQAKQFALSQARGYCEQDHVRSRMLKLSTNALISVGVRRVGGLRPLRTLTNYAGWVTVERSNSSYGQARLNRTDIRFRILAHLLFANDSERSQESNCMVLTSASSYCR